MPIYQDQLGRDVHLPKKIARIVSIVPSQTELIADLGAIDRLVGRTKFCVHPDPEIYSVPVMGGTKKLHLDKILSLKPDLIIANKEENSKSDIESLAREIPVWVSDIASLDDALEMIQTIGKMLNSEEEAMNLGRKIENKFNGIQPQSLKSCLYLIWRDPWMAAGSATFISSLLPYAGFKNCVLQPRYPEINTEILELLDPEVVLLSSEPYPFAEKHLDEVRQIFPSSQVHLVDGEMFSWYGSRLLNAPDYFNLLRRL